MHRCYGAALFALMIMTGGASAQSSVTSPFAPPRPDAVRPNSQNLMQGPNYWTPQQRRLNVPSANSNPSLRQQGPGVTSPPPPVQTMPPPPTPVPAETPKPPA